MRKNVCNFEMRFIERGGYGDLYLGSGFIGGRPYVVERLFLGYTKKEIIRLLKKYLLEKAGR